MARDLLVNLLAAGLAFLLGFGARSGVDSIRRLAKRQRAQQTRHRRHPRYTAPWLATYYLKRHKLSDLFMIECHGHRRIVPFITKAEWQCQDVDETELLVQTVPHERSTAKINKAVLRRRGRYLDGIDPSEEWNDLISCVVGVEEEQPRIRIQQAEYFQFLSVCGALEDETYNAVRSPERPTPIRDVALANANVAAECRLGAQALGMQVAFVFEQGDSTKILIQRRSDSVSIYGGALAVVPVYGCQTLDLTEHTEVSLFHNFLREVFEELYGGEEVERRTSRVDPQWFYREPSIARIIQARKSGLFEFNLLGFGFDALNGEMDLCALALVRDPEFANEELAKMSANWEIHDIQVWDLFGDRLSKAVLDGEFSPGSVYTIARSRQVLLAMRGA